MAWVWVLAALMAACVLWWPVRVRIGFSCAKDKASLRLRLGPYVLYSLDSGAKAFRDQPSRASANKSLYTDKVSPAPQAEGDIQTNPKPIHSESHLPELGKPESIESFSKVPESEKKESPASEMEKRSSSDRRMLQVLLTPGSEAMVFKAMLSVGKRFLRIFRLRLLDLEVHGLLDDPYWNGVWIGLSAGHFLPDWGGDQGWRAKGELSISVTGGRVLFFAVIVLVQALSIAYRATRLYRATRRDPHAQALPEVRRWILDKLSPLDEAELHKG